MFLGIDTSNYTTSVAVLDGDKLISEKKLLSVKKGERGLRQSDALFQHTVNLPCLFESLGNEISHIDAVAVSDKPRNAEGSYMPCFLAGVSCASAVSSFTSSPIYKTSHQVGHILAALYSCKSLELVNEEFIGVHLSGGTTEVLLVKPDKEEIIKADLVAQSLDLKAGQAVDRTGVMLGLDFPCGKALDDLSLKCDCDFKIKPSLKGADCSLSGVENKVKDLINKGSPDEYVAKFVVSYLCDTVDKMIEAVLSQYGQHKVVCAGGVMSNTIIRNKLEEKYNARFAKPELSSDNACGIAVYGRLKYNSI